MNQKPLYHRFDEPWLITEGGAVEFATRFSYEVPANIQRRAQDDQGDDSDVSDLFGKKLLSSQMLDNIGIISISGVMISGAGFLENIFGGISHAQIESALVGMAARNPSAIILSWNSPGGTVSGTCELAGVVGEVSSRVPTYSFCGAGLCASAAYWVGSSAGSGFYTSPSSMVGSIGCLLQTISIARLLENAGIDAKVFTSAALKASGSPLTKLSDDQAGYLQNLTNEIGGEFQNAVRKNRPGVSESVFDGRVFSSKQAASMGLTDGVVSNFGAMFSIAQSSPDRRIPADAGGLPRTNRRPSNAKSEVALQRAIARGQAPQLSAQFQGRTAQVTRPAAPAVNGTLESQWAVMSASDKREFGNSFKTFAAYARHKHQGRESLGGGSVSSVTFEK